MTRSEKQVIKEAVEDGLIAQFETYTWEKMIDDLILTKKEKEWAKKHLDYTVIEI